MVQTEEIGTDIIIRITWGSASFVRADYMGISPFRVPNIFLKFKVYESKKWLQFY